MSRQTEILLEIAKIHREWYDENEDGVDPNPEHSKPHDTETGDSDYGIHYVDVSASPEQEKVFQDRIQPLMEELKMLNTEDEPKPITAALDPDAPSPLYFTVDENENVLELVKEEENPDATFVRNEGEWVDISSEEEFPTVDDQFIHYANDESVSAWDSELEENENLKLSDIASYIIK